MPPVSAISTASGAAFAASVRLIACATSVEPVKTTPAIPGAAVSGAPTVGPSPGRSCSAAGGTPAACSSSTARAAISGVCSAGLAITALPAPRQAATWPVKIASGKFQGLMQTMTRAAGGLGVHPDAEALAEHALLARGQRGEDAGRDDVVGRSRASAASA